MFTLQQLQAAHSKVKTGADFPAYIHEIKELGLVTYNFHVSNGAITYHGKGGYEVTADAKYATLLISETPNADELKSAISIHQQGQTDFETFCRQVADAGVSKWEIDTANMVCRYVDTQGHIMVTEPIPML